MNTQKLAKQALNYLASLKSPLPCDKTEEGKEWYKQNEKDYQALLTLNKAGFGSSEEELQQLANSPMADKYAKTVVAKMEKIDNKINELYVTLYSIAEDPRYIEYPNGVGHTVAISYRGQQRINTLNKKIDKLMKQVKGLQKTITYEQACKFYPCIELACENEGYLNSPV